MGSEQSKDKVDDTPSTGLEHENVESEEETLEAMARKALECPCVADLRDGPCGRQFSEAFICYFKSTAEEKGSDCVKPFLAMQACMEASPELFKKIETEEEDSDTEGPHLPRPKRRRSKSPPPPTEPSTQPSTPPS